MSNKVDIAEVEAFSNDLEEVSSDVRSSLDKVQERVNAVNNMESFSGKAAKEAKSYFNELHLTLLESFRGLFDDLNENLNQHIKSFGNEVDAGESAVIESNYLQDVKEDINEVFASLKELDESIHDTIGDVSEISSATSPDFSDVQEWKKKSVKKIQEVDEDLDAFTSKDNEVDVNEIMHQIEAVMSKATTSKGKARFADFKGASGNSELAKLMEYNEEKQNVEMEKAKDARDGAIQDQNKHSSKNVINKAFTDYKNGDIKYDQYLSILNEVDKTNGNMNQKQLTEESTGSFIKYLDDNDLLEQYLGDHKPFAHHVVESVPETAKDTIETFLYALGYNKKQIADYLKKSEDAIRVAVDKPDPKASKDIKDTYKQSKELYKYGKYVKGANWLFAGVGLYSGYQSDIDNGKTGGQAVAHNLAGLGGGALGAAFTYGATVLLGASPVGWAAAAGIGISFVATFTFEYLYDNNKFGIQDKIDKVGETLDKVGEAISSGWDAINPFA